MSREKVAKEQLESRGEFAAARLFHANDAKRYKQSSSRDVDL